nr:EOG090X08KD [Macrothrix elegans]
MCSAEPTIFCSISFSSLPKSYYPSNVTKTFVIKRPNSTNFASTNKKQPQKGTTSRIKMIFFAMGTGFLVGLVEGKNNHVLNKHPPIDRIAKKVIGLHDYKNLEITLFQYEPCPFCKKVRAYLDFLGLSYNIVEVNPITKSQLKWSNYKKVPVLVVKGNDGYQQLNDSTAIISILASYFQNGSNDLSEISRFYPEIQVQEDNGKSKSEIMNRYFLMFGEKELNKEESERIAMERKWRLWSDNVLMHTLSPNIYRTWEEALEAFRMFSQAGNWDQIFSYWDRQIIIYLGAFVMYLVGKRLKKRHNLLDDPRQSLYNEVNYFLKELKKQGSQFIGGKEPNLADLSIYGCISSIEGTKAFDDVVQNTNIASWLNAMQSAIASRRGKIVLNDHSK